MSVIEGKVTAVPKLYKTWRYPIVFAWKKMFGCHNKHLFFVTDYYEKNEEGKQDYLYSDFKCEVCGMIIGGPPK